MKEPQYPPQLITTAHTHQGDLRLQSAYGIIEHFIIPQRGVGKEWEGQRSVVCLNNRGRATVLSIYIVMLSGQNHPLTDSLTLGQLRSIVYVTLGTKEA